MEGAHPASGPALRFCVLPRKEYLKTHRWQLTRRFGDNGNRPGFVVQKPRRPKVARSMTVGIIAFGSLLREPGHEIAQATQEVLGGLTTPFGVEFARSSHTRDGAPTLVPCEAGQPVSAKLIVLRPEVEITEARDLLFRRESRRVCSGERYDTESRSWIAKAENFANVEVALYTALPTNIDPLSAERLADLAVASAQADAGAGRLDGISYLIDVLALGTETALTVEYRQAILDRLGVTTLEEAWRAARSENRLG